MIAVASEFESLVTRSIGLTRAEPRPTAAAATLGLQGSRSAPENILAVFRPSRPGLLTLVLTWTAEPRPNEDAATLSPQSSRRALRDVLT